MTATPIDLAQPAVPTFAEQRVIWWREQAQLNWRSGDYQLSVFCERNAAIWERDNGVIEWDELA